MEKYHITRRIVHWVMAVLIIIMLIIGFSLGYDLIAKKNILTVINLHKSFGVLVLILITLRIILTLKYKKPPLPPIFAKYIHILSSIAHKSLYILMFIMPMSGWLMSNTHGYKVSFFKLFDLPTLLEKNHQAGEVFEKIHFFSGWFLTFIIILHISGALKHKLENKSIFYRMNPFAK